MDRGTLLRRLALALAAIGVAMLGWYVWGLPKTLKLAVGPAESSQHRFAQAMARALKDSQQSYRLELIVVPDSTAASTALDRHKVDLAILRSDDSTSAEARSVAVLQRRHLVVVARKESGIEKIEQLKGKPTAILNIGAESNRAVFATILQHYGITPADVPVEEMDVQAVAKSERTIDAYVLFANPASGLPKSVIDAVRAKSGGDVTLVAVPGAEGLSLRYRELQKGTIPEGAFGGTPAIPDDPMTTVTVTYELTATSTLGQTEAKDLLTALVDSRTRLRRLLPRTTFDVEAPAIGEQRRFLAHSGASAYVNDEDAETFLETYSEQIWLALFGLSIVGSSIAGLLGWTGYFDPRPSAVGDIEARLRAVAEKIETVTDPAALEDVRAELDSLVVACAREHGKTSSSGGEVSSAALIGTLMGILDRRKEAMVRGPVTRQTA